MALIKLAAASAVGYALYQYITRRNDAERIGDDNARQPVPAGDGSLGSPVPTALVGLGNGYVAPT